MDNDYWKKHYLMAACDGMDGVTVEKCGGSDWSTVKMEVNGSVNGELTIRSKAMAEQLHFMLGQMLGK